MQWEKTCITGSLRRVSFSLLPLLANSHQPPKFISSPTQDLQAIISPRYVYYIPVFYGSSYALPSWAGPVVAYFLFLFLLIFFSKIWKKLNFKQNLSWTNFKFEQNSNFKQILSLKKISSLNKNRILNKFCGWKKFEFWIISCLNKIGNLNKFWVW
jgi:hypothetical protein